MHLLVCTDGTTPQDPALLFGCRLAPLLQARVTVLGASDQAALAPVLSDAVGGASAELHAAGLPCEVAIRQESLWRAIPRQASTEAYDLVVVNPRERDRLQRWLSGPSIRHVLRDVTTSALVVPVDRPQLRHILLCSGDLWYPTEAIRLVSAIALATAAEVTLLYVTPDPVLQYPILHTIEDAWGALLQTDTPQGRNLKAGRDELRRLGIQTGIKLRHGKVDDQILAEIRSGEYDLVALGSSYGAQGLRHHFVSSITDFVVERAGRPVMVVRRRRGDP